MATKYSAIRRAIKLGGGVTSLAVQLKVTPQVVSNWQQRKQAPAEKCLDIERLTGVTRHDLRPDVFGPAPQ